MNWVRAVGIAAGLLLFMGCSEEATCKEACSNIEGCGMLAGDVKSCTSDCEEGNIGNRDCLADTACHELGQCFANMATKAECQAMCTNVYETCKGSMGDASGNPIPAGDCVSSCTSGFPKSAATCLGEASCASIPECMQR